MSDPPTDHGAAGQPEATPRTVFIVEPEILVRMVVAEYLRQCGYTVIEGLAAADVLAVLQAERHVDVILADLRLEGEMDGFGLARWIRDHHPGIDVILTSNVPRTAEKAGDLCDEGPLEKPYHPQEVVRRIGVLLERRRSNL